MRSSPRASRFHPTSPRRAPARACPVRPDPSAPAPSASPRSSNATVTTHRRLLCRERPQPDGDAQGGGHGDPDLRREHVRRERRQRDLVLSLRTFGGTAPRTARSQRRARWTTHEEMSSPRANRSDEARRPELGPTASAAKRKTRRSWKSVPGRNCGFESRRRHQQQRTRFQGASVGIGPLVMCIIRAHSSMCRHFGSIRS
jgi:hypothetical protein